MEQIIYLRYSDILLSMLKPSCHRVFRASSRFSFSVVEDLDSHSSSVTNPLSTHLNRPLALYCANEYCVSVVPMEAFEWRTIADGMSIEEPLGNLIMRPRSQRTM